MTFHHHFGGASQAASWVAASDLAALDAWAVTVPEPAGVGLAGLLGLRALRRRRAMQARSR